MGSGGEEYCEEDRLFLIFAQIEKSQRILPDFGSVLHV